MPKRDDVSSENLVALYSSGLSTREMGERVGMKNSSILYRLKQSNVVIRSNKEGQRLAITRGRHNKGQNGERNHNWRGGRIGVSGGYYKLYDPKHPRSIGGYVWEHQVVWERTQGIPLPEGWVVHHMNGNKGDNRPENLKGMTRGAHINLGSLYIERIRELEEENKMLKLNCYQKEMCTMGAPIPHDEMLAESQVTSEPTTLRW